MAKIIWQADSIVLNGVTFELPDAELATGAFKLLKGPKLLRQYEDFWSLRADFQPQHIFELGIWKGGSLAFWFEYFQPAKHLALDLAPPKDNELLQDYIESNSWQERIKTYWAIDQRDRAALQRIVERECDGALDLVIDDASHMYEATKASFETLFPLLRPAGWYIIEDWTWQYNDNFRSLGEPWASDPGLVKLIYELTEALGKTALPIANLSVYPGFVAVKRGA